MKDTIFGETVCLVWFVSIDPRVERGWRLVKRVCEIVS